MSRIRAGRAFDGERVVPGAAPAPDGCQVLDLPGGTVLPGLVDAHVHLCADGTNGTWTGSASRARTP